MSIKILLLTISLMALIMVPNLEAINSVDLTQLGGDLTSSLPGRSAIQVTAPNVDNEERRILQLSGFGIFHGDFQKKTGLGPSFINASCKGCHIDNGKGPARFSRASTGQSTMVVKVSLPGLDENRAPINVPGIGEQLLNHSVQGRPQSSISLAWTKVNGKYPDGSQYELRKPNLSFRINGLSSRKLVSSLRMTPPVIGPGLIEAIPDSEILKNSDPSDKDRDGISGRPNYVLNSRTGQYEIGRFGFKASHPTLEQQVAAALVHDMGISNPIFFNELNPSEMQEITDDDFSRLVVYQKLAGVPKASNQSDHKVIRGKVLFQKIGCSDCHIMTQKTEEYSDPELSNQTFHPFTDLLLHDMGPDLADKRAEYSAKGSEWKTTPLWGLGFSRRLAKRGKALYLHDGRARTIEEAILWHGGEAKKSKLAFTKLPVDARSDLLEFLDSL